MQSPHLAKALQGTLEVVTVDLSHDSHLQEFYAPGEAVVTQIRWAVYCHYKSVSHIGLASQ